MNGTTAWGMGWAVAAYAVTWIGLAVYTRSVTGRAADAEARVRREESRAVEGGR